MAIETGHDREVKDIKYIPKDPPFVVVGSTFAAGVASKEDGEEYIRRYYPNGGSFSVRPAHEVIQNTTFDEGE